MAYRIEGDFYFNPQTGEQYETGDARTHYYHYQDFVPGFVGRLFPTEDAARAYVQYGRVKIDRTATVDAAFRFVQVRP